MSTYITTKPQAHNIQTSAIHHGNVQVASVAQLQSMVAPVGQNVTTSGSLLSGILSFPNAGFGGQYSVGVGATGIGSSLSNYTYHGLDMGLLNRPSNFNNDADDTLYPVNMRQESAFVRFHLQIWRESLSISNDELWSIVDSSGDGKAGFPIFRSRAARTDFLRWWKSYGRFFDNPGDQVSCFLPTLIPGSIKGTIIEHKTFLDNLPYSMLQQTAGDGKQLEKSLLQLLPAWVWIVSNCKSRVFKIQDGWLFTRATDAALFPMFAPWSNNHT